MKTRHELHEFARSLIGALFVWSLLTSAATGNAATVVYQSWKVTGTTNNRAITYKPRADLSVINDHLVYGTIVAQPTNGVSTNSLLPAGYFLTVDGVSGANLFSQLCTVEQH